MITVGEAAIPLETTRRAFRNQSQSKQRSTLVLHYLKKLGVLLNSSKIISDRKIEML